MLNLDAVMVVSINIFVQFWWLYLDEPKGVIGKCIKPIRQIGWWLLIIHGRNPRLHVCFDKVNNGLMCKIISSP